MIQAGKEAEKRKQKYINSIFNQSNVNYSLHDATVNNYKPQNEQQAHAKNTAIEYVKTFSVDKPKSLILQGSYGTGKSHIAYAIAKAIKMKVIRWHLCTFQCLWNVLKRLTTKCD